MSETVDRPMPSVPARAYAMTAREDQDAPKVIAGIFSLYDIEMHALIDPSSTHSYVCIEHVFDKIPAMDKLAYDMHVTSPLGHSISVNRVYRNCPIVIQARGFLTYFIPLPFRDFDLILEMDWLSKNRAIVNCGQKIVVLRCSDQTKVMVQGIRTSGMSNVISTMQARRFMRKGCETFLAVILDSKRGQVDVEKIPVVREFPYVFPQKLPGIPLEREVDLAIEIIPGTVPLSRAPYRMAPVTPLSRGSCSQPVNLRKPLDIGCPNITLICLNILRLILAYLIHKYTKIYDILFNQQSIYSPFIQKKRGIHELYSALIPYAGQ